MDLENLHEEAGNEKEGTDAAGKPVIYVFDAHGRGNKPVGARDRFLTGGPRGRAREAGSEDDDS